jgi:hypothetical protein
VLEEDPYQYAYIYRRLKIGESVYNKKLKKGNENHQVDVL